MALKPVGALWTKDGKKGKFLSGTLDLGVLGKATIMIFPNEKKENNQPDYRMYLAIGEAPKPGEEPEGDIPF